MAYELQWRLRGKTLVEWNTSATLIVGSSCRKKNLEKGSCYEFRVRAASAWGWSGYSDTVMVVTCVDGSSAAQDEKLRREKEKMKSEHSTNVNTEAERARANVSSARRRSSTSTPAPTAAAMPTPTPTPSFPEQPGGIKRNDSWAWRRDNDNTNENTNENNNNNNININGNKKPQPSYVSPVKSSPKSFTPWQCVVCKRANSPDAKLCGVCFTKKDYKPKAKDATSHPEKERRQRNSYAPDIHNKHAGSSVDDDTVSGSPFNSKAAEARRSVQQAHRPQTVAGNTPNSRRKDFEKEQQKEKKFEAEARVERPWWEQEEENEKDNDKDVNKDINKEKLNKRAPSIRVRSDTASDVKKKN